jgi:hypothetical protein
LFVCLFVRACMHACFKEKQNEINKEKQQND